MILHPINLFLRIAQSIKSFEMITLLGALQRFAAFLFTIYISVMIFKEKVELAANENS